MKIQFSVILNIVIIFLCSYGEGHSQNIAIKTNLLYCATTTPNIGIELPLNRHISIDVSGAINPFNYTSSKQLKHWLVKAELRWWLRECFYKHFAGIHAFGGKYNVGGIGLPFFNIDKYSRYQGYGYGIGLNYGYNSPLKRSKENRWNIELSIGLGYSHLFYSRYRCINCGERMYDKRKNYYGITKASVALIYNIH